MKGLLRKDLYSIIDQKVVIIVLLFIAFCYPLMGAVDSGFTVGYISFVSATIGLATIGYDFADSGMLQIMTLPVDRKMYVQSKYVTCMICVVSGMLMAMIAQSLLYYRETGHMSWEYTLLSGFIVLFTGTIMTSAGIPSYIKFGAQKGVYGLLIFVIAMVALILGCIKLSEYMGYDLDQMFAGIAAMEVTAIVGFALAAAAVIMIISYMVALKIIDKKTF